MTDIKYREDCKDKWYYIHIDHMEDEDLIKSEIKRICPKCNKEQLIREFVIPSSWDGYQTWRDECHTCNFKDRIIEIATVMKKLKEEHLDMEFVGHVLTPNADIELKEKK
jgi:hypothetical protein